MSRDTDFRLRERYAGIIDAAPDAVVTLDSSQTLHLPARDRDGPVCCCQPERDWTLVDTQDAIRFGGELCHGCFRVYLEQLSRDPSSGVERVDTDADADPNPEIVTHAAADGGRRPRLAAYTERVGRVSGGGDVYHAPTGDGALCGEDIDTFADRERLDGHFRPCSKCFAVDE